MLAASPPPSSVGVWAFLVGIELTLGLATLALGGFFLRAWRVEPAERTFLHFSLAMFTFGLHVLSGACGVMAAHGVVGQGPWLGLAMATSHLGVAFLLHFGLLYASVPGRRFYTPSIYGLAGAAIVLEIVGFDSHPSTLFFAATLALLALVARRWAQLGEGSAVVGGTLILVASAAHDMRGTPATLPAAVLLFGFSVALTFLQRYGVASADLESSTRELQRRSKELEASYRELKRTQQQLVRSEQLAVVGELSAVIAHEVRNPLAIVSNAVASLHKKQTKGRDRKTLLNIISEEMGRLDQLVSRLVHYARPILPAREKVDLVPLIERALVLAENRETSIELEGSAEVVGDPSLLRQAFDNVVQNAVQATAEGGHITVVVADDAGKVAVGFRDDGEGMSLEAQRQALFPFFTTRPTGTGLGLPIVSRIAEAHGGHLSIDSTPGEGTTVTLHLDRKGPRRRSRARSWP